MSRNPGNTGQRYSLYKVTNAQVQGGKATLTLECGHSYTFDTYGTQEEAAARYKERIGKRTRCNECEALL